jgi:hypothetical protein
MSQSEQQQQDEIPAYLKDEHPAGQFSLFSCQKQADEH